MPHGLLMPGSIEDAIRLARRAPESVYGCSR